MNFCILCREEKKYLFRIDDVIIQESIAEGHAYITLKVTRTDTGETKKWWGIRLNETPNSPNEVIITHYVNGSFCAGCLYELLTKPEPVRELAKGCLAISAEGPDGGDVTILPDGELGPAGEIYRGRQITACLPRVKLGRLFKAPNSDWPSKLASAFKEGVRVAANKKP